MAEEQNYLKTKYGCIAILLGIAAILYAAYYLYA